MSKHDKALGELRQGLDALYRRIAELEKRLDELDNPKTMTGSVDGLDGAIVVTMPEGWFR